MKFERKRGIKKIKIYHNKWLLLVIIVLIILLAVVLVVNYKKNKEIVEVVRGNLCAMDGDCVPSSSCHPTECIFKTNQINNPEKLICSAVCSGPLDCGAGSCGCVNHKCAVVPNE